MHARHLQAAHTAFMRLGRQTHVPLMYSCITRWAYVSARTASILGESGRQGILASIAAHACASACILWQGREGMLMYTWTAHAIIAEHVHCPYTKALVSLIG